MPLGDEMVRLNGKLNHTYGKGYVSQHTDIAGCARHTEHKEPLERNSTPTKISNILVLPPFHED